MLLNILRTVIFMKKLHIIEASIAIALMFTVVLSIVNFGFECSEIRSDVIRLHILANSDSEEDQQVKIIVRDVLLNCGKELFSGNITKGNAEEVLNKQKDELIKIANKTLAENGFNYKAQIYLTEEYFTTRSYENFTLPAGEYLALKVVLGEGGGHNWWCVMFPPLCLPAASGNTELDAVVDEDGAKIIQNYDEYEMRFKVVELFESIKNKIKSKNVNK